MVTSREFMETRPSLLAQLGAGGPESRWREFFDLYAPAIFGVARARGLGRHDAEDIVQQVMVSVLGHIGSFEYSRDRGRFRSWIRRVTENKIIDLRRRRGRARAACAGDPGGSADASASASGGGGGTAEAIWEEQWERQDLLHCLSLVEADISPRRMEAFRLYVLRGLSAQETARRLGMSVGHVYVVRCYVLDLVRKRLGQLGEGDPEGDRP